MAKQRSGLISLLVLLHLYLLNATFCPYFRVQWKALWKLFLWLFLLLNQLPFCLSDADQILPTMQLIPALTLLLPSQILTLMSFEMTVWLTLKWVWVLWVQQGLDCLHHLFQDCICCAVNKIQLLSQLAQKCRIFFLPMPLFLQQLVSRRELVSIRRITTREWYWINQMEE